MSRKVFICSPYRGENITVIKNNIRNAQAACKMALNFGFSPVAPHLYYPQMLDDNSPKERHRGMVLGLEALLECEQMWVFGVPSEGMKEEMKFAEEHNIPVYFKDLNKK